MMPVMLLVVCRVGERMRSGAASRPSRTGCRRFFPQHRSTYIPLNSPPVFSERVPLFAAEITRLEEVFQAQQSGHVPMHEVDANDARARLWSVAAFNRMLKL